VSRERTRSGRSARTAAIGLVAVALAAALAAACAEPDADEPSPARAQDAGDAEPEPAEPRSLPIEVLGAQPGVEARVVLTLAAAELAAARDAALALTLHNIVEPDSAYLSVNGGPAIDLGARDSALLGRSGQLTSGRIALALDALVPGQNALLFRYTRQVPNVSGYRVLAAAIELDGAPAAELTGEWEAPASWTPFDADADTLARGREYFQEISRDGGPTCARCHADSGADLQYFAFSNHSIVQRAMFHEFSRDEARAIASYLRSLDVPREGLIYDPPFQPGSDNRGARGAGRAAVLSDDPAFCQAAFGAFEPPSEPSWDWAQSVDTYRLAAALQMPTWFRWLPRELRDHWLELEVSVEGAPRTLRELERALAEQGTQAAADRFMTAAVDAGKRLLVEEGDHAGRIELLRFAAVKLWDWSRRNGFDAPDHGFPDRAPPYPYEVGFAFFEAALADEPIPEAMEQVLQWWWAQLALHAGRGFSNGLRPLNYRDVLLVAESANAGPCAIAFLHLLGSFEESRGAMAELWGSERGPARLLGVPMRRLDARGRELVMRRFLREERARIAAGVELAAAHHTLLATAWAAGCDGLDPQRRAALRALAPEPVRADLSACP
jgi:hypothetical protein